MLRTHSSLLKLVLSMKLQGLCEEVAADVTEVARGIGLDARIGKPFPPSGSGMGGELLSERHRCVTGCRGARFWVRDVQSQKPHVPSIFVNANGFLKNYEARCRRSTAKLWVSSVSPSNRTQMILEKPLRSTLSANLLLRVQQFAHTIRLLLKTPGAPYRGYQIHAHRESDVQQQIVLHRRHSGTRL